jgi:hypothetical protein
VIQSENGNVFGGFIEEEWSSYGDYVTDPNAFIFSLINYDNKPFKVMWSNCGRKALFGHTEYGPSFGCNEENMKDIITYGNGKGRSDFGYSFKHPDYEAGSEEAKSILAGSETFKIFEIEVFAKEYFSTILSTDLVNDLNELCEVNLNDWSLIYRASRDGFSPEDFHFNCDNLTKTLTIIKSENGNIFGGYIKKEWNSECENITDPNAFIFSLINEDKKPFKSIISNNGDYAAYCDPLRGPNFGGDESNCLDICIDEFSQGTSSIGYSFKHPGYEAGSEEAKSILAGSHNFKTIEIEVYKKIEKY